MLESTVTSSARTEKRAAYRDSTATIGLRDQHAEDRAGAAEQQTLGEQRAAQRAAPAPSAARTASSPSRRTERARIRLATFEHAITNTSAGRGEQHQQHRSGRRRDLVAQQHGVDAEVGDLAE